MGLRVHVICQNIMQDRILPRMARYLAENLRWSVSSGPNPGADAIYLLAYFEGERFRNVWFKQPVAAYFTHREEDGGDKARCFDEMAGKVNLRIATCRLYAGALAAHGLTTQCAAPLETKRFTIVPRQNGRRPVVGFSGYTYSNHRKGEDLVRGLLKAPIAARVEWRACGRGWPVQTQRLPWAQMPRFYQGLDVLVVPSRVEGIPMPPLEALACFPADTLVHAEGVTRRMRRTYTGEMITIKTGNAIATATADHPFAAIDGWRKAKDIVIGTQLWYNAARCHNKENDNATKGSESNSIFAARIGDLVAGTFAQYAPGACRTFEQAVVFSGLAMPQVGPEEVLQGCGDPSSLRHSPSRPGLHSGSRRWRGGHNAPVDTEEPAKTAARSGDFQYFDGDDGLATVESARAGNQDGMAQALQELCAGIFVSDNRAVESSLFRGNCALPCSQAAADRPDNRVLSSAPEPDATRTYRSGPGDLLADPCAQLETVEEVSRREVIDLPVFNLTTDSSCYWAEGFLVHNCGVRIVIPQNVGLLDELGDCTGVYRYPKGDLKGLIRAVEQAAFPERPPDREALRAVTEPYSVKNWCRDNANAVARMLEGGKR